jgi:uncharacterized LabA/DUF88 family protein
MLVIGFGEKKTPKPFISACDKFIYLEILKPKSKPAPVVKNKPSVKKTKKEVEEESLSKVDAETIELIRESVNDIADDAGWTFLAHLGNFISKKRPDFDPRNYGFQKLLPLIKDTGVFEIDERETGVNNVRHIYLKTK